MKHHRLTLTTLSAAVALASCSSLPERIDTLETARTNLSQIEQDPLAREAASSELQQAREALRVADESVAEKEPLEIVEHQAYIAKAHTDIAEQLIAEAHARETLENGEAERNRVLLEAREREAQRAEMQARQAQQEAQRAERIAAERGVAAVAEAVRAESAETRAQSAEERAAQLESQLSELQAEQTERGLVLTISDVLFDTDAANLKPGAANTMNQLTSFLDEYSNRKIRIEGHTDARGSAEYNKQLSQRRAEAVKAALKERGVGEDRITTIGLGEDYPEASNDTPAGMQQNRRVEIVISDEEGSFPSSGPA